MKNVRLIWPDKRVSMQYYALADQNSIVTKIIRNVPCDYIFVFPLSTILGHKELCYICHLYSASQYAWRAS